MANHSIHSQDIKIRVKKWLNFTSPRDPLATLQKVYRWTLTPPPSWQLSTVHDDICSLLLGVLAKTIFKQFVSFRWLSKYSIHTASRKYGSWESCHQERQSNERGHLPTKLLPGTKLRVLQLRPTRRWNILARIEWQ